MARLTALGVIPVVRVQTPEAARRAVGALVEAGFTTAEITMTVPGALELIQELSGRPDLLVGAGTVLDLPTAEASIRAGARYLVTPCLVEGVPELCREADLLCITGALTPTEILTAWRQKSGAVKVFPVDSMGGPAYLRALKAVFPTIPLIPTGGVKLESVGEYLKAGAVCVGAGSDLVSPALLEQEDAQAITVIGRMYLQAVETARRGG
ncbi:MAG: bifunctional 4-hydroxy-2-oxoglutarate aldolase/2-dehydro-3-deoxy-phosphogluconate aldolase [Bacillota bacterium]